MNSLRRPCSPTTGTDTSDKLMVCRIKNLRSATLMSNVKQSGLLYSTHPSKRIDIFTPDAIREGVTFKRVDQLTYANIPYALDFYEGRLFVSSNGKEKFCEVDPVTGEILKDYTVVGDVTSNCHDFTTSSNRPSFVLNTNKLFPSFPMLAIKRVSPRCATV